MIRSIRVIRGSNPQHLHMSRQTPNNNSKPLSEAIIGAAMAVHNELKPGLDEKLYENALVIELRACGHQVKQQKAFKVDYKDQHIGTLIPDLLIDQKVIVDTKVVSDFNDTQMAQMSGYLAITNLRLSLLINFKHSRLQWKRVVK